MARWRFLGVAVLALIVAFNLAHARRPADQPPKKTAEPDSSCCGVSGPGYAIYSLAESTPDFGRWVAETIPEVIEPGTWKGPGAIRYYAPKSILVVHHSPAVQAKVARFLDGLKKSAPGAKGTRTALVPAGYRPPALLPTSGPTPEQGPTFFAPVPAPRPKHLFHFIIRYEGDGIIDDNVVKYLKTQSKAESKEKKEPESSPALATPAAVSFPAPPVSPPSTSFGTAPPSVVTGEAINLPTAATETKEGRKEVKMEKVKE